MPPTETFLILSAAFIMPPRVKDVGQHMMIAANSTSIQMR
jgi:hypothetical protein